MKPSITDMNVVIYLYAVHKVRLSSPKESTSLSGDNGSYGITIRKSTSPPRQYRLMNILRLILKSAVITFLPHHDHGTGLVAQ